MPDLPISGLPVASSAGSGDLLALEQSGTTKQLDIAVVDAKYDPAGSAAAAQAASDPAGSAAAAQAASDPAGSAAAAQSAAATYTDNNVMRSFIALVFAPSIAFSSAPPVGSGAYNGVGLYTLNFSPGFADTNYHLLLSVPDDGSGVALVINEVSGSRTNGSVQVAVRKALLGSAFDPSYFCGAVHAN